jgi:hypothetical protein
MSSISLVLMAALVLSPGDPDRPRASETSALSIDEIIKNIVDNERLYDHIDIKSRFKYTGGQGPAHHDGKAIDTRTTTICSVFQGPYDYFREARAALLIARRPTAARPWDGGMERTGECAEV